MAEQVTKSMINPGSVDLVFPLQTEVTIEISKLPEFIAQVDKLFTFYKKSLQAEGNEIKGYDLSSEIAGLKLFLNQLEFAIKIANTTKPVIATIPEKTSIMDFEFVTLRIVNSPESPIISEQREFSDGSRRDVILYNKIDFTYLENKTFAYSMAVLSTLQTSLVGINSSTLALIFNHKEILKQINAPVPSNLLICQGRETALSKIENGFSLFGFDVGGVTSKVLIKDFLNAYIHPAQTIIVSPRPPIPKGCTEQARNRISILRSSMNLFEIQAALAGGENFLSAEQRTKYKEDKKEFIELTKLCPDLISEIAPFESLKQIDKLGKLFTNFLEKYNLACIVDEAIKCVMPQIPCDQILRDLTVDNFEQRLKTAFPHQKNIIDAITLNVREAIEEENRNRQNRNEQPLEPAQQTQIVLDTINKVIDLEALCKIDIQAIAELIKNLFNIKLPSFNLFDWQFNFKIDFDLAVIEALLRLLLSIIEQVLNELVGCDALDGLIAGILNSNIEAPTGLYGDIAAMFGGNFDFSNLDSATSAAAQNFLTQSGDQLSRILVFETKLGNNLLGDFSVSGTLGFGRSADNILAAAVSTELDTFGGLARTSTYTTGNVGVAGFNVSRTSFTGTIDTTKLASSEGQKEFLKEIGKFQLTTNGTNTEVVRVSDDSLIQLLSSSNTVQIQRSVPVIEQELQNDDIYTTYKVRNKNRHILQALINLNQQQNSAQLLIPQSSLAEQLKDYIRTCFALLTPSETIDLITAKSSLETKLTITEIARIRYPLLNAILRFPDRHALLFASFGKLTNLDSIGPRLQILSSQPSVKQKVVDPNVCAPFSNLSDFRKNLMLQTLPQDLANNLIDDLIEDDRTRANRLINSLGQKPNVADLMTSPAALSQNKTPDGRNIEEVDRVVNNTLSNLFDQIKLSFDREIESYANATAASKEVEEKIYKYIVVEPPQLYGFKTPAAPEPSINDEYIKIKGITNSEGELVESDDVKNYLGNVQKNRFHIKKVHKDVVGELVYKAYDKITAESTVNLVNFDLSTTGKMGASSEASAVSSIRTTAIEDDGVPRNYSSNTISELSPKWKLRYREITGSYIFDIRTSGQITSTTQTPINYAGKLVFTGSLFEENPIIIDELASLGYNVSQGELSSVTRVEFFKDLFTESLEKMVPQYVFENPMTYMPQYVNGNAAIAYKDFLTRQLLTTPFNSQLLKDKSVNKNSQQNDTNKQNKLLTLIDFSPLPTEQEKYCGIDTHLLQLESVKKRVKEQYNSTIPDNLININSKINTRYSDSKPGHLSEKIMTGLAETFIRTSVAHNMFKGLFMFDQCSYSLAEFSLPQTIYIFFEHVVKKDIASFKLEEDFTKEIDKIFNLYQKDENRLIPENDNGLNKLQSIIKYHVDDILKLLNKIVKSYTTEEKIKRPQLEGVRIIPTASSISIELLGQQANSVFGIPVNNDLAATKARNHFFEKLSKQQPYSNFYIKSDSEIITSDKYIKNPFASFTSNIEQSYLNDLPSGWNLILEEYVRLDFKDLNEIDNIPERFRDAFEYLRSNPQTDGVVSIKNFQEIMQTILFTISNRSEKTYLFDKDGSISTYINYWFKTPPKYGLRISLVKTHAGTGYNIDRAYCFNGFYDGMFINDIFYTFRAEEYVHGERDNRDIQQITKNKKEKVGTLQSYKAVEHQSYVELQKNKTFSIIPILSKEIEVPRSMYEFDNTNLPPGIYSDDYMNQIIPELYNITKRTMLADPVYDLLVNYCFMGGIGNNFGLFNSLLGLATEPIYTLLDGTKQLITKNYIIQKNSGNFKSRNNTGEYEKQKKASQDGPPPLDYLKAAATIPINLLKGISTAVDPNIFLADKIVLAGKMGMIQPKFRRVEVGEIVRIEGSTETKTIESGEEGVAYDGYYKYLGTGELEIKSNPTGQGNPITEFTVMAQVDPETKKVIKRDGKVVTAQGLSAVGIPYDIKKNTYIDPSFDENEEVDTFDQRASTPIFPGESINVPYSVASLLLAPFPIFTPGLTTYNIAMPFGPLFLALEPLLFQTPQFKASVPKRTTPIKKDSSGNIVCEDEEE